MKNNPLRLLIAALLLPGAAAFAAPMGCLIEPERSTDVGSPVVGVIERIDVERGQRVKRGQVLAVLRAGVERATLAAADSRAEGDADLKAAAASAAFNRERLVRAEDLFRQQFISAQALEQTRTEVQLADQKLAQAREQRTATQHERSVAAAQLSQRVIRSPMDGVVAERYLTAGERVDDKPLLRIARVDPLRVQLVVPVALYGTVQQSGGASIQPDLPGAAAVLARVTMIDRVVDAASNTFRVQLELPNADGALPAGLRCKAEFTAAAMPVPVPAPPPMPVPVVPVVPAAPVVPVKPATGVTARPGGVALAMTLALPEALTAETQSTPRHAEEDVAGRAVAMAAALRFPPRMPVQRALRYPPGTPSTLTAEVQRPHKLAEKNREVIAPPLQFPLRSSALSVPLR